MKKLKITVPTILLLTWSLVFTSCSKNKVEGEKVSVEKSHTEMKDGDHHDGHNHGHEPETVENSRETKKWFPRGSGIELIKSDFHFITGNVDNISPEVIKNEGNEVLQLTADGTTTAFVFHNQYSNVGVIAILKNIDFKGTIKVIHHAKDFSNYEYASIMGGIMKLGRVAMGKEVTLDKSDFISKTDWIPLKVTAAGSHYKGYIGDRTITHSHANEMENGFVGIMLEGTGKVQIKSIEIVPLEGE